jgi:hypothetical protein
MTDRLATLSYVKQWRSRSKEVRSQAEQMTYAETKDLMLGIANDFTRIADIAEAMAELRSALANSPIFPKAE